MQINSFGALGGVFGVSPRQNKTKPFRCRKCGREMRHLTGTNIYLCENTISDGTECGHKVFVSRAF